MNEYQRMRGLCHRARTAIRFRPGETFHDESWGWEGPAVQNLLAAQAAEDTPPRMPVQRVLAA